ncbi:MAG: xanthine dehydrogenase family protein molybdopterin-binding subunit [Acidobacteriia bacterium]|nr:xanthine dehydrogenase family protein molybdopterin-binding subunit [Terriglobia bacterium]
MQIHSIDLSVTRRSFLSAVSAAGGAFALGCVFEAAGQSPSAASVPLNAWVVIEPGNLVKLIVSQAEIGQGIATTMPAVIADELGADWSRVRFENSPTDPAYRNPRLNWQFTGNSESTTSFFDLMREMGAGAREMLISAASDRLKAPASALRAERSRVTHPQSGRSLSFADLAADAAKKAPPRNPPLKPASQWTLMGKALPRVDTAEKVNGKAVFGIDFRVPNMAYASVKTCPVFGGKVASVDRSSIAGMPGVIGIVDIPNGVAVAAESWWQAHQAVQELKVAWENGANASVNSAALNEQYKQAMATDGWLTVHQAGDKSAFGQRYPTNLSAEYESQFMAHATMEPMNCTASVTAEGCDIWAPTQGQEMTRVVLAQVLGLPPDKVRVSRTYVGGAFGRRLVADFAVQAALVSKAVGRPAKVVWSREEDMRHDFYRPAVANRLAAGIDEFGRVRTLYHQVASPSILQYVYPSGIQPGFDPSCVEGMLETRYEIPNTKVDFKLLKVGVPTSVLRTTGYGPNLFAIESFIDELANLSGKDPYLYRRDLLSKDERALRVLDLAAEKSHWRDPLKPGHYRGIAFCEAFRTLTCHVVELSVNGNVIHIHQVTAVGDAGNTLDPGISANSFEGGVAWGLTCAMKSEITFADGGTVQSNFHDYPVVRMFEMPPVEVYFVESGARPLGGVGEVGPVTVIPALTNAIFAATGVRYRSLPLSRFGLTLA